MIESHVAFRRSLDAIRSFSCSSHFWSAIIKIQCERFFSADRILQFSDRSSSTMREASVQSENFLSLIEQAEFAKALKLETLTPVQSSYCLYRLNKLEEALDKLPKNPSPASSHLKAQIFYRMERYEDAAKLYATLLSGSHISLITSDVKETYQSELETNCNATMAAAFSSGSETTLCAFEKGSYELIFNRALVLAAQSRYEDALALFSGLEDICTNELKEIEADQGEIDKEVGKIRVQIGVVLQLMNEAEKAVEIYDSIVDSSPVVNAILANNRGS
jgi:tetratricopeptide (TPR) repeat protein